MMFDDRIHAGKVLAQELQKLHLEKPVILALPRGGVAVAYEVARKLNASLDVLIVRKLGSPGQKEFGIGAIAENDIIILDQNLIDRLSIKETDLYEIIDEEKKELERRRDSYGTDRNFPDLKNKTVVLIDDGLATGITAKAAVKAVQKDNPEKIILAVPVCSKEAFDDLSLMVDKVVSLVVAEDFDAVGKWYKNFEQVSDEQVINMLKGAQLNLEPR